MSTFSEILDAIVAPMLAPTPVAGPTTCRTSTGGMCTLCLGERVSYDDEVELKKRALDDYWRDLFPSIPLRPFVPSPMGRRYRTVTKRKLFFFQGIPSLGLIDPDKEGTTAILDCGIEPETHNSIYEEVQRILQTPRFRPLADVLRYVVVKGNYREQTVILTVRERRQKDQKSVTALSKKLTAAFPSIVGMFCYLDRSDGRYYLGEEDPRGLSRIFGNREIYQKISGRSFLFSPLSFSQINQSLIDQLIQEVLSASDPGGSGRVIDLYCGYGVFSLCLAEQAGATIGIERSAESVQAARENAKRQHAGRSRFVQADINAEKLGTILPTSMSGDVVILDPPRGGTEQGVLELVAARKPRRIIHLFCNSDIMAGEVKRWEDAGYVARWARPFDMFPGTRVVEFLVVFEPKEEVPPMADPRMVY